MLANKSPAALTATPAGNAARVTNDDLSFPCSAESTCIYIPADARVAKEGRVAFVATGTSGIDAVFDAVFRVAMGSAALPLMERLLPPEVPASSLRDKSFVESLRATGKLLKCPDLPSTTAARCTALGRRLATMALDYANGFFDGPRALFIDQLPGVTRDATTSEDGLALDPVEFGPDTAFRTFETYDRELVQLNASPATRIRHRPLLVSFAESHPGFDEGVEVVVDAEQEGGGQGVTYTYSSVPFTAATTVTPAKLIDTVLAKSGHAEILAAGVLTDMVPVMLRLRVVDDARLPVTGPADSALPRREEQASLDVLQLSQKPKTPNVVLRAAIFACAPDDVAMVVDAQPTPHPPRPPRTEIAFDNVQADEHRRQHRAVQPHLNEAKNRARAREAHIAYFSLVAEHGNWHLCSSWRGGAGQNADRNRCAQDLAKGRPRTSRSVALCSTATFPTLAQITAAVGHPHVRLHSLLYALPHLHEAVAMEESGEEDEAASAANNDGAAGSAESDHMQELLEQQLHLEIEIEIEIVTAAAVKVACIVTRADGIGQGEVSNGAKAARIVLETPSHDLAKVLTTLAVPQLGKPVEKVREAARGVGSVDPKLASGAESLDDAVVQKWIRVAERCLRSNSDFATLDAISLALEFIDADKAFTMAPHERRALKRILALNNMCGKTKGVNMPIENKMVAAASAQCTLRMVPLIAPVLATLCTAEVSTVEGSYSKNVAMAVEFFGRVEMPLIAPAPDAVFEAVAALI
ncbi:hypothetical protein H9P43_002521 [Blastocladiella emersonii ATCC 22665]|nr:hypothetical protein H9P43_002521 [Blastocladiella emersonii ATCC 22665]